MKTKLALLTALALLLAACDQPAPKNEKPAAAQNNKTTETDKTPQPNGDNKTGKPATDTKTGDKTAATAKAAQPNSDNKNNTPAADTKTGDKPAASDSKTDIPADNKDQPKDEAPATPAPPPTYKTAAEALPYIQSQLPYDTQESSFRSVTLDNDTYTFTAVVKGVEDAAAFRASHDMESLASAYRQTVKPYICDQEPLKSLGEKKKYRGVHFDYQDEHGQSIMQIDIAASDCTATAAGDTTSAQK